MLTIHKSQRLVALAMVTFAQIGMANVCQRSPLAIHELENAAKKSCDQISADDLSRMDHFQIGFTPELFLIRPHDTQGLSAARFLYFNCNPALAMLPDDLTKGMDKLQVLAIHTNPNLRSLPEGIFTHLSHTVRDVMMMDNGLTTLPESFYQRFAEIKTPITFYLSGNPFTPETIERLQKLFDLELENGEIPRMFRR